MLSLLQLNFVSRRFFKKILYLISGFLVSKRKKILFSSLLHLLSCFSRHHKGWRVDPFNFVHLSCCVPEGAGTGFSLAATLVVIKIAVDDVSGACTSANGAERNGRSETCVAPPPRRHSHRHTPLKDCNQQDVHLWCCSCETAMKTVFKPVFIQVRVSALIVWNWTGWGERQQL